MSVVEKSLSREDVSLPTSWRGAWKKAAFIGAVGLAASVVGAFVAPARFGASYLFAFLAFVTLAVGSLFFVLLQHLVRATWSVGVRRCAEVMAAALPVFFVLALPLLAVTQHVYPWDGAPRTEHAVQSGAFANANDEGDREPAALRMANRGLEEELTTATQQEDARAASERRPWLNRPFFAVRTLLYLALWSFLAWRWLRWSTEQDGKTNGAELARARKWAPLATIAFAVTLQLASFDWWMSLEANWYSTVFGIYVFAGCMVGQSAALVLFALTLRRAGRLHDAINVEHYHDLGKSLFAWMSFWAYVAYVQFFLAWYANIPEEIAFFHERWGDAGGSWKWLTLALCIASFAVPFVALTSRNAKRNPTLLGVCASLLLAMHVLETYWLVMPAFGAFAPHWLDVACLVGVGGAYGAAVLRLLESHALVPTGDPDLERSLAFENA